MLSREIPFHDIKNELLVIVAIGSGQMPVKPITCTDPHFEKLWSICLRCWASKPKKRPIMAEICVVCRCRPMGLSRQRVK